MNNVIPKYVCDELLHLKDTDRTERVVLPFTRYANVLNSPKIVTDEIETPGAPFHLLETDDVELTVEEIRNMCGSLV